MGTRYRNPLYVEVKARYPFPPTPQPLDTLSGPPQLPLTLVA